MEAWTNDSYKLYTSEIVKDTKLIKDALRGLKKAVKEGNEEEYEKNRTHLVSYTSHLKTSVEIVEAHVSIMFREKNKKMVEA